MRKVFISVLLAATVVAPAFAEGRGEHDMRDGGFRRGGNQTTQTQPAPQQRVQQQSAPQSAQQPAPQMARGNWQGGGGGWNRSAPAAQQQAPIAQPQAQQANNRGNWGRGDHWQGQQTVQPQAAPVQVARDNRDHRDWNRRNDGEWNRGDNGRWNRGNERADRNQSDNGRWNQDRGRGWAQGQDRRWHQGEVGNWNRDWRRDQRYNWQAYRDYNRDFFRVGAYYNPYGYGYGYQSFGIGGYLDDVFFSTNYWINDPYAYRLPAAYGDTRWIRYYNDVLLVDVSTGEVIDVIHNFFW